MSFCPKCSAEHPTNARFCPACAAALSVPTLTPALDVAPDAGSLCPACGRRSPEGSAFCMWAGHGLRRRPQTASLYCPKCRAENVGTARFCTECATNFAEYFGEDAGGRLLAGRYRLLEELGRGGMGMVWLAADTQLGDRQVAIKVLPPEVAQNAAALKALKKEATLSLELTDRGIVRLHNFEVHGDEAFLVMEYVAGQTLADILIEEGPLPAERVLPIARQLLQAIG